MRFSTRFLAVVTLLRRLWEWLWKIVMPAHFIQIPDFQSETEASQTSHEYEISFDSVAAYQFDFCSLAFDKDYESIMLEIDALTAGRCGEQIRHSLQRYVQLVFEPHMRAWQEHKKQVMSAELELLQARQHLLHQMRLLGISVNVTPNLLNVNSIIEIIEATIDARVGKPARKQLLTMLGFTGAMTFFALPPAWMLSKECQVDPTTSLFASLLTVWFAWVIGEGWWFSWLLLAKSLARSRNNLYDTCDYSLPKPILWINIVTGGALIVLLFIITLMENIKFFYSKQAELVALPVDPLGWSVAPLTAAVFTIGLAVISSARALRDTNKEALETVRTVYRFRLSTELGRPYGRLLAAEAKWKQVQEQDAELAARACSVWMRLQHALYTIHRGAGENDIQNVLLMPGSRNFTNGTAH